MITNTQEVWYYFVPAVLVIFGSYMLIKRFTDVQLSMMKKMLDKEMHAKMTEMKSSRWSESLPLKLQAYERLILFMERISPNSLLVRVHQANMTAQELYLEVLVSIRAEFEHNLSQQLYVSDEIWSTVVSAKDEILDMVNTSFQQTGSGATGVQLSSKIFEKVLGEDILPTHQAILAIKSEAQQLFN